MKKDDPELRAAYDEMKAIVQKIEKLESESDEGWRPGLLMDYLIITTTTSVDDNGDDLTTTAYMKSVSDVTPHYRLLGMLEYVRARLLKQVMED